MDWKNIKALKEQRGQMLADMQKILKAAENEKRDLTDQENVAFDALNKSAEERKLSIERYESAEKLEKELQASGAGREQRAGREDLDTPEKREAAETLEKRAEIDCYLRTGQLPERTENRAITEAGAGVVGDRPVYNALVTSMKSFFGVLDAGATVIPTTHGNDFGVPMADDTDNEGSLVGEADLDHADDEQDPDVDSVILHAFKFDSKWIKVSTEMLQDTGYPIEPYILNIAGERIGKTKNRLTTLGTGSGQPNGVARAAGVGKVAASTDDITYEELIDLVHSVDAGYRKSPAFRLMLNDTTLAAVRKMKDDAGRFIFAAGAAGIPSTIFEFKYIVNNHMAQLDSGVNSKVVVAGDFARYFVRDVTSPQIIRASELFAGAGLVGFRVFQRGDGQITDANAFKTLALAAA